MSRDDMYESLYLWVALSHFLQVVAGTVFVVWLALRLMRLLRKCSGLYGGPRSSAVPSAPAPVSALGTRHIISAHYVALVVAGRAAQLAIGLPDAHKCHCLSVEAA